MIFAYENVFFLNFLNTFIAYEEKKKMRRKKNYLKWRVSLIKLKTGIVISRRNNCIRIKINERNATMRINGGFFCAYKYSSLNPPKFAANVNDEFSNKNIHVAYWKINCCLKRRARFSIIAIINKTCNKIIERNWKIERIANNMCAIFRFIMIILIVNNY